MRIRNILENLILFLKKSGKKQIYDPVKYALEFEKNKNNAIKELTDSINSLNKKLDKYIKTE